MLGLMAGQEIYQQFIGRYYGALAASAESACW